MSIDKEKEAILDIQDQDHSIQEHSTVLQESRKEIIESVRESLSPYEGVEDDIEILSKVKLMIIAEDEKSLLDLFPKFFKRAMPNTEFKTFETANEALHYINSNPKNIEYALLITDHYMPGSISGLNFAEILSSSGLRNKFKITIIVNSSEGIGVFKDAIDRGVIDDYSNKRIFFELRKITENLKKKWPRNSL
ncbi:hypothetical protein GF354_05280 [Candidatus Peregrinibacteria bacterium]|nr:hypothetical protein [Candidatus Peregrinibacteria bacterium]